MPSNVIPRGDRFAARVTLAGRQVWLGTYETEDGARAAVARARGRREPHALRNVADLCAAWEALDPRARVAETVRHRAQMVAPFVRAYGRTPLEAVSVAQAQAWATGRPGSVRYLRSMFECAVRVEALERNVWRLVRLPERAGGRLAFTEAEVAALALAATLEWPGEFGLRVRDMVLVAAYTGVRLSELAELRVSDALVPRPAPYGLAVTRLRVRGGKGEKPRVVAVFHPAAQALAERAAGPRSLEDDRLLFRTQTGRRWNRKSVSRMFGRLRERAGVEGTWHSLRHFHGSWLLDQGASDLDVAVQLGHFDKQGHADATLVRRVYGHPSPAAALERLDAAVHNHEEGSDGATGTASAGADGARALGAG